MKNLSLLGFIFFLLISCNNSDDKIVADCSEVACTEIYITLIVSVQDNSGVAIPLDRFEVSDKETDEDYTIPLSDSDLRFSQLTGEYPLINDSFVAKNKNTKKTVVFKGFINETIVAEAEYVIDTDCCHVSTASGNNIILVN